MLNPSEGSWLPDRDLAVDPGSQLSDFFLGASVLMPKAVPDGGGRTGPPPALDDPAAGAVRSAASGGVRATDAAPVACPSAEPAEPALRAEAPSAAASSAATLPAALAGAAVESGGTGTKNRAGCFVACTGCAAEPLRMEFHGAPAPVGGGACAVAGRGGCGGTVGEKLSTTFTLT